MKPTEILNPSSSSGPLRQLPDVVVDDPTPAGIAGAIGRMISTGELVPGDRLPTVRDLAAQLGVSPATVSHGWKALSRSGLVVSRGRSGTFVADAARRPNPSRTNHMARTHGAIGLDLSRGAPDPRLLPEIGAALASVARRAETTSYHEHPVVPELGELLARTWPYPAAAMTVVDGALDAVTRAVQAVTRYGDRVVVEDPTFPQFLDLLDSLGLQPIPVPVDDDGIDADRFNLAMSQGPAAAILQPRAHNPTGACMTSARAKALAASLRSSTSCVVIEDDHSGAAVSAPDISLGRWLPDRVLHVRSFSKSHGPDLRIAAMSGPKELIDRIATTRKLGPGWTPRILQRLLCELLTDETSQRTVDQARAEYQRRRDALSDELASHGVYTRPGQGLNLWVPVTDERNALIHLAANGIQGSPGEPFLVRRPPVDHLRVTVAPLDEGIADVARTLAAAAQTASGREYFAMR